ncbi:MAG: glutamine--tRNA ligase, partial [Bdellovibrionales bacterium]|nr:glutamine--tRNA ligase [Bdellovibrionales bacterium]
VAENLELFTRMRNGDFQDGECVLRAKIDMGSPNMNLRDPTIYRIRHEEHHRTGDKWCIYPMYDFAHGYSDALEGITHSICTLEFEDHRPLYDWFLRNVSSPCHPQQIEFARLNVTYTVLSKRKLLQLVEDKHVSGWDDPRMPTISGMRRRGYTPEAIREFCERIGVAKANSIVDIELLNFCQREHLNRVAQRAMAVIDPVKLIIDNYPEGAVEELEAENNPEDPAAGKRLIPFSRELFIEREDFMEDPPKKFFRLSPGAEVRLKHAYYVRCTSVEKNERGEIVAIHCDYDPNSKGGWSDDGRKVKGTLHWVSAQHAKQIEVRLYDHLFVKQDPEEVAAGQDFTANLNSESLEIRSNCWIEPALFNAKAEERFQFLRLGYFCVDARESLPGKPVFNRIVGLRDSWAKEAKKSGS